MSIGEREHGWESSMSWAAMTTLPFNVVGKVDGRVQHFAMGVVVGFVLAWLLRRVWQITFPRR